MRQTSARRREVQGFPRTTLPPQRPFGGPPGRGILAAGAQTAPQGTP